MKYFNFSLFAAIFFLTLFGCGKEESAPEIPKSGEPFARALRMEYYFSNEFGDDLLIPQNEIVRPLTFELRGDSLYFHGNSEIDLNPEKEKYYWNTVLYGRKGYRDFQFFVQISESDIDTLTVEYRYTTGATGGDGIYANIDKLYYNQTLIRSMENTHVEFVPEEIHITKSNGRTLVSIEK